MDLSVMDDASKLFIIWFGYKADYPDGWILDRIYTIPLL